MPNCITAKICRCIGSDGEVKEFAVNEGDKVSVLLEKANLTLGKGEEVNDEYGNAVSVNEEIKANGEYFIIANYKNGSY